MKGGKSGAYILVVRLKDDTSVDVGAIGTIFFRKGYYAYVGSAMSGIAERVRRHFKSAGEKRIHWHIDYLLEHARITGALILPSSTREECAIARRMAQRLKGIHGFGATDCSCASHLYYAKTKKGMGEAVGLEMNRNGDSEFIKFDGGMYSVNRALF